MDGPLDVEDSRFLHAMREKLSDLYAQALERQWVICVPVPISLQHIPVTISLMKTHILQPSPFFVGFFTSLTKKTVEIDGDYIVTRAGFSFEDHIRIIKEERFYNRNLQPYRVLVIERPLDGTPEGSVNQHLGSVSSVEVFKEAESLSDLEHFLRLQPSHSIILKEVDKETHQFNISYVIVRGFEDDCVRKLLDMYRDYAQEFLEIHPALYTEAYRSPRVMETVHTGIHSYVMHRVYEKTFSHWREVFEDEDEESDKVLRKCSSFSMDDLQIPKDMQCPLPPKVQTLCGLNQLTTIYEKLLCVRDVANSIIQAVQGHRLDQKRSMSFQRAKSPVDMSTSGVTAGNGGGVSSPISSPTGRGEEDADLEIDPLTTDDLIPLMAFALTRSIPKNLISNMEFMLSFQIPEMSATELGFNLVTLHAAVEYLRREAETIPDDVEGTIPDLPPPEYVRAHPSAPDVTRDSILRILLEKKPLGQESYTPIFKSPPHKSSIHSESDPTNPSENGEGDQSEKKPPLYGRMDARPPKYIVMDDDLSRRHRPPPGQAKKAMGGLLSSLLSEEDY
eukprot:TRINITY_DN2355_c0_g1_i1.p1 TRINITY_DN2355_c0_g1~~TRINITY_DN2355_c0_g1_i1.p1  ORF type:complete len:562 (+),score=167.78 TRINITY_DN2355_c0_g1_i1:98-1783(+)